MHMCVCVACPDGTGLPVSQRCKSTISPTHECNPSRCVQSRDCTHTIDGRELTNRHNSIRELLMHMCVCVACPDGTGLPVSQRCKSTISPTHECNPSRCVQSRDCTHTIDGRELTNRHNSIRELLMHMCVCVACPDGTGLPVSQRCKSTISPTHE